MMNMISGLSHLTFAVSNLDHSFRFYVDLLGLKPITRWNEGAYLLAGDLWIGLMLDKAATEATNNSSYTHAAFAISPDQFCSLHKKLVEHDVEEWQTNNSPGESFYFLDPDGHKLEIHARTLPERLAWLRENPKPGLTWFQT